MFKFKVFDAKKNGPKHNDFKANQSAESAFYRSLKKVAQASGHLVEAHTDGATIKQDALLQKRLKDYADALGPWAQRQSAKMLEQVARKNKKAYESKSKLMGIELKLHLAESDVGKTAAALMSEQVALIKSIPLEAGQRAQALALQALLEGTRATPDQGTIDEIKKQLGVSTEVAVNRAKLIARTEVARSNASITQARAAGVGATAYVWRTSMDGAERDSHAKMNGKTIQYNKEPTLIDGTTGHAGTFPNCRCWQDAVF